MLNIKKRCLSTELLRSLDVEMTVEKLRIQKLNFVPRLLANQATANLYNVIESLKVPNSMPTIINEIIKLIGNPKHWRGEVFTLKEKASVMADAIKMHANSESRINNTVKMAQKIMAIRERWLIAPLLEYLLHSKKVIQKKFGIRYIIKTLYKFK